MTKVKTFKNSRPNDLDDQIDVFLNHAGFERTLVDLKVGYGVSTSDGMIDDAIVVVLLYTEGDAK